MTTQNPKSKAHQIIKHLHVTEKASMLQSLKDSERNLSSKRCKSPKYVFVVDKKANKQEIAKAVEEIYSPNNVKVTSVNTITIKPKATQRRGIYGKKAGIKKAIVTLSEGDSLGIEGDNNI